MFHREQKVQVICMKFELQYQGNGPMDALLKKLLLYCLS